MTQAQNKIFHKSSTWLPIQGLHTKSNPNRMRVFERDQFLGVTRAMKVGSENSTPRVAVIMGSRSDWETMRHAGAILTELAIPHECRIVSAHRTPDFLFEYVAGAKERGIQVIIAGAGGAAHLPGMAAAKTILPVLGVPVRSRAFQGFDSLLSIVQMPTGIPVATHAIGEDGAVNAALQAAAILALADHDIGQRLKVYHHPKVSPTLEEPT